MPTTTDSSRRAQETANTKPVFDRARCKRCGICAHFCPFGAIAQREDGSPYLARPELCTSCGLCKDMCPDWAIRMAREDPGETEEGA